MKRLDEFIAILVCRREDVLESHLFDDGDGKAHHGLAPTLIGREESSTKPLRFAYVVSVVILLWSIDRLSTEDAV